MAYVVEQQASVVYPLGEGVLQLGVERTYGVVLLMVGVGIEAVDVYRRVLCAYLVGRNLGGVHEYCVAGARRVGVVGEQRHKAAPAAAGGVGAEVGAHHVALYLVNHVRGLGLGLGGQAAHADIETLAGGARLVAVDVTHHVVAAIGDAVIVERVSRLVCRHHRQVVAGEVARVEGGFAEEEQVARRLFGVPAAQVAQQRAYGHGVLLARRELVVHLLVGDHEGLQPVHDGMQRGQPLRLGHETRVRHNDEFRGRGAVQVLVRHCLDGVGRQERRAAEGHILARLGGRVGPPAGAQRHLALGARGGHLPHPEGVAASAVAESGRRAQMAAVAHQRLAAAKGQGHKARHLYIVEVSLAGILAGAVCQ